MSRPPLVLIVYATREGHTRKIADHVAARIRARGLRVDVIDAASRPVLDLSAYAHVVLAASAHLGKHEPEMVAFVKTHRAKLDEMPTSLLSVSLSESGAEEPKASAEKRAEAVVAVKGMIDRFLADTDLHPGVVMPVAGALPFSKYGWLVRLVMRQISKRAGGPTDTSHDYEMTDWVALDRFVDGIVSGIERAPTLAPHPPPPI